MSGGLGVAPLPAGVSGAIEQLYAANWMRIDHRADANVGDLFVEDGLLKYGEDRWAGRAAIDDFYNAYRISNAAKFRTTRHLSLNHHIVPIGEGGFRVSGVVFVFSGIGDRSPLPSAPPSGIGDFDDECVIDDMGRAFFQSRRTTMIFADASSFDFSTVRT